MNIYNFFKLLIRHWILILLIPTFMAVVVYYLTKDDPKLFSSETEIYTGIASGYDVDMKQGIGDRFMVQSVFENILTIMKSRTVREEVALRLLAQHLVMEKPNMYIIEEENRQALLKSFPDSLKQKLVAKADEKKTYEQLRMYMLKDHTNYIYRILYSKGNFYSMSTLNSLAYRRLQSSDIVKISYKSTDPGVCVNTLVFFSDAFIKQYRSVKMSETGDIVKYFEEQLKKSEAKLNGLEDQLLNYRSSNNILDYTEQARAIAQRRQEMEGMIYEERMRLSAAEKTADYAEKQLEHHLKILSTNNSIVENRKKLERLAANAGFYRAFPNASADSLNKLEVEIEALKAKMEKDLSDIFAINYTSSGMPSRDILKKWFDNVISVGESQARLEIYDQRTKKFKELYATMAPVGSNLTKIERKVGVAESEYLRILEALNLAKLRQQNIALSTKLKVVGDARYPTTPDASKQKMLLIIAFLLGLVLVISVLVILSFIDNSVKTAGAMRKLTDLGLAGLYPYCPKKISKLRAEVLERLDRKLLGEVHAITNRGKTAKIAVMSFLEKEGKGWMASRMMNAWEQEGVSCKFWSPNEGVEGSEYYEPNALNNESFFEFKGAEDQLIQIVEVPALQYYATELEQLKHFDLCLLVVRVNRSWQKADRLMLEQIKDKLEKEPLLLLNGVRLLDLEEILGPLPRKRNKIRSWIRRILHLEFS